MLYQLKKRINSPWILLLILGVMGSCKPESNNLELAKFLIDSIQSQSIPDARVEVFQISATSFNEKVLLKGKTTNINAIAKLDGHLRNQGVDFIDSITRLPDTALKGKTWGLVNLSVANIRYNPAHSAEMATQALMGTPVKVLQEQKGWFLIQTPDNYIAWTEEASIFQLTSEQMDSWKQSDRLIFLSDFGLIRESQEKNATPVSDIVAGSILAIDQPTNATGDYIAVRLPDGRRGFLQKPDIRNFREWCGQTTPDSLTLVNTAFDCLGRPYLWGGTSMKAFDCSGFTKSVFLKSGLILARDASQQVQQGSLVSRSEIWENLKAGDLLFFGRIATPELAEKATHVGMYIGNSEFIHCSGLVRINSLDSTRTNFKPYYLTNLLKAKRIIGSQDQPVSFNSHPWYN
jgi:gamma-D-glutamyl-L-lysine dipeptidyl-peptidase